MSTSADSDRERNRPRETALDDHSDGHGRARDRGTTTLLPRLTRYDLLLAVVPVAFLLAMVVSHLTSLPARTGLVGASLVGSLVVVDALFRNPPLLE